jgi:hypothetical protein
MSTEAAAATTTDRRRHEDLGFSLGWPELGLQPVRRSGHAPGARRDARKPSSKATIGNARAGVLLQRRVLPEE